MDVLRRFEIRQIIGEASHHANLLIFDAGALFGSASTIHLAQIADVVVLAIPLHRQRVRDLTLAAQQLQSRRGQLLPVATPMKRRRWASLLRRGESARTATDCRDVPVAGVAAR